MPETNDLSVYERHGTAWAELRNAELVESWWLDRFTASLPDGAAIVDIGRGSGTPIGVELVRRGYAPTGVDGAASMLASFRKTFSGAVTHQADMRALALGFCFAWLLVWDTLLHLLPVAQRPMFARFAAHASPNAVLMFTSGNVESSAIGLLEVEKLPWQP